MVERRGREYGNTSSAQEFSREDMWKAFKDWKVWVFCVAQFGVDTMLYGECLPECLCRWWLTAKNRVLDFPPHDHQRPRHLDRRAGAAPHGAVLRPRRGGVHDRGLPVGPQAAPRAVLRRLRERQRDRVRDSHLGHLVWGALLWVLPGGGRVVRRCRAAACLGEPFPLTECVCYWTNERFAAAE